MVRALHVSCIEFRGCSASLRGLPRVEGRRRFIRNSRTMSRAILQETPTSRRSRSVVLANVLPNDAPASQYEGVLKCGLQVQFTIHLPLNQYPIAFLCTYPICST